MIILYTLSIAVALAHARSCDEGDTPPHVLDEWSGERFLSCDDAVMWDPSCASTAIATRVAPPRPSLADLCPRSCGRCEDGTAAHGAVVVAADGVKNVQLPRGVEIHGFYHVGMLGRWKTIVADQVDTLERHGLLDASAAVHVGIVSDRKGSDRGDGDVFEDTFLGVAPTLRGKAVLASSMPLDDYETGTVNAMVDYCAAHPKHAVWYLHTKGVTTTEDGAGKTVAAVDAWRRLMEYFTIGARWRGCASAVTRPLGRRRSSRDQTYADDGDALPAATACGLLFRGERNPHYAGNIYWARCGCVRKLPKIPPPLVNDDRADAECLLLHVKGLQLSRGRNIFYTRSDSPCGRRVLNRWHTGMLRMGHVPKKADALYMRPYKASFYEGKACRAPMCDLPFNVRAFKQARDPLDGDSSSRITKWPESLRGVFPEWFAERSWDDGTAGGFVRDACNEFAGRRAAGDRPGSCGAGVDDEKEEGDGGDGLEFL